MKPGITGVWQVSGKNEIADFNEIVKMDVQYIENWSLWMDLKILLKTAQVVLLGQNYWAREVDAMQFWPICGLEILSRN